MRWMICAHTTKTCPRNKRKSRSKHAYIPYLMDTLIWVYYVVHKLKITILNTNSMNCQASGHLNFQLLHMAVLFSFPQTKCQRRVTSRPSASKATKRKILFQIVRNGRHTKVNSQYGYSLVPRPRPAFHRLQYGKAVGESGNMASTDVYYYYL